MGGEELDMDESDGQLSIIDMTVFGRDNHCLH